MGREIRNCEYRHLLTSLVVKERRQKGLWPEGEVGTKRFCLLFFNMSVVIFKHLLK